MFQPTLLGLEVQPTIAMKAGRQQVWQCAQCGLVAVQTDLAVGELQACPACGGSTWWEQELPLAGLRRAPQPDIAEAGGNQL